MYFTPALLATLASVAVALPAPILDTVTDVRGVPTPDVKSLVGLPVDLNVRNSELVDVDAEAEYVKVVAPIGVNVHARDSEPVDVNSEVEDVKVIAPVDVNVRDLELVDADAEVEDVKVVAPIGVNLRDLPLPKVPVVPQVKVPSIPAVPSTKTLGVDGDVSDVAGVCSSFIYTRTFAYKPSIGPERPLPRQRRYPRHSRRPVPEAGASADVNVKARDTSAEADALIGLPANLRTGVTADSVELPDVDVTVRGLLPVDVSGVGGVVPTKFLEIPKVPALPNVGGAVPANLPELPKIPQLPVDVPEVPAVRNVV
ncbi:hypothetical protein BDW74DRAFT_179250 [Aspergillus multicolor]|uniref:uncharacterized protein n=1 Tax=Aspergillus multicolor TaxID=41759 RepID=UPI003CCDDAA2